MTRKLCNIRLQEFISSQKQRFASAKGQATSGQNLRPSYTMQLDMLPEIEQLSILGNMLLTRSKSPQMLLATSSLVYESLYVTHYLQCTSIYNHVLKWNKINSFTSLIYLFIAHALSHIFWKRKSRNRDLFISIYLCDDLLSLA